MTTIRIQRRLIQQLLEASLTFAPDGDATDVNIGSADLGQRPGLMHEMRMAPILSAVSHRVPSARGGCC